jgi:hypothetical protein
MQDCCKLRTLNKGDFFTLKEIDNPKENQVYVKEEYDRNEKAYWCSKFNDFCTGKYLDPNRVVFIGFTF